MKPQKFCTRCAAPLVKQGKYCAPCSDKVYMEKKRAYMTKRRKETKTKQGSIA